HVPELRFSLLDVPSLLPFRQFDALVIQGAEVFGERFGDDDAQVKQRQSSKLTELDLKFHFFPWWKEPQYSIAPEGVII
ncbi:hypothetical protein ACC796_36830, partial [Rhizobium ruizarguesonis]